MRVTRRHQFLVCDNEHRAPPSGRGACETVSVGVVQRPILDGAVMHSVGKPPSRSAILPGAFCSMSSALNVVIFVL